MRILFLIPIIFVMLGCKQHNITKLLNENKSKRHFSLNIKETLSLNNARPGQRIDSVNFGVDTFKIVSESPFFYYPFGKYKTIQELLRAEPIWHVAQTKIVDSNDNIPLYKLSYKRSYIHIIKYPDTRLLELVKVLLVDNEIILSNGIHVGMTKSAFLTLFFKGVDPRVAYNFSVIKVISAVDGIWNEYYFDGPLLRKISFETDFSFNNE